MDPLSSYRQQQYMNIETYRKTGEALRTPVWFVEANGELCFTTEARSGKVKRLRRNPAVRVAPCKVNGELVGDWHPGTARFLSEDEIPMVKRIYSRKYGIQKVFFDLAGLFQRQDRLLIAVRLTIS